MQSLTARMEMTAGFSAHIASAMDTMSDDRMNSQMPSSETIRLARASSISGIMQHPASAISCRQVPQKVSSCGKASPHQPSSGASASEWVWKVITLDWYSSAPVIAQNLHKAPAMMTVWCLARRSRRSTLALGCTRFALPTPPLLPAIARGQHKIWVSSCSGSCSCRDTRHF